MSEPQFCYVNSPIHGIIIVERGKLGFVKADCDSRAKREYKQNIVDTLNKKLGVDKNKAKAMLAFSMWGWNSPSADVRNYVEPERN